MKLPKEIEKKRDELADKGLKQKYSLHREAWGHRPMWSDEDVFRMGFNAATEIFLEREGSLLKALKDLHYVMKYRSGPVNTQIAMEQAKEVIGQMEEVK